MSTNTIEQCINKRIETLNFENTDLNQPEVREHFLKQAREVRWFVKTCVDEYNGDLSKLMSNPEFKAAYVQRFLEHYPSFGEIDLETQDQIDLLFGIIEDRKIQAENSLVYSTASLGVATSLFLGTLGMAAGVFLFSSVNIEKRKIISAVLTAGSVAQFLAVFGATYIVSSIYEGYAKDNAIKDYIDQLPSDKQESFKKLRQSLSAILYPNQDGRMIDSNDIDVEGLKQLLNPQNETYASILNNPGVILEIERTFSAYAYYNLNPIEFGSSYPVMGPDEDKRRAANRESYEAVFKKIQDDLKSGSTQTEKESSPAQDGLEDVSRV